MRGATLDMQNTKKYADQRDLEFQNAIRLRRPTQPKRKKDYADQRSRELQSTKRLRRQRSPELQWYTPTNGWRTLRRNVFREKNLQLLHKLLASWHSVSWAFWACDTLNAPGFRFSCHIASFTASLPGFHELGCADHLKIMMFFFSRNGHRPVVDTYANEAIPQRRSMTWSFLCVCNVQTNMLMVIVLKQVDLLILPIPIPSHVVSQSN